MRDPAAKGREGNSRPLSKAQHMARAAWVFTSILFLVLIAVAFLIPEPTETQAFLFRFFMAASAAFCCYFWVGNLAVKGRMFGQQFAAGGGVGLFLLMFFSVDPQLLRTKAGDYFPLVVVPDAKVEEVQQALKGQGLLKKPADGIRDSETTRAIRQLQAQNGLRPDGTLSAPTLRTLFADPLSPGEGPPDGDLNSPPRPADSPEGATPAGPQTGSQVTPLIPDGISPSTPAPAGSPQPAPNGGGSPVGRPQPPQNLQVIPPP